MSSSEFLNVSAGVVVGILLVTQAAYADGSDDAGNSVYVTNSWQDAQNGGSGFEPWTLVSETTDGFAGFFAADDLDGSRGVDNVGVEQDPPLPYTSPETEGYVWATFANEGGGIDRATAFRAFSDPLTGTGDSFTVSYEHGFVNGQAGVALRAGNVTTTAEDHATGARAQFYFAGGDAVYTIEDDAGAVALDGTGGLPSVPFTFFGIDVQYTLTGPDTYDLRITKYNSEAGSGGAAPDVFDKNTHAGLGGRSLAGTGAIESLALFQNDVENQSDAFFNNLAYSGSGNGGGSGADNAGNYLGLWIDDDNFGTGFGNWEMTSETDGGFAGQFIQSGAGNGVENIGTPAPDGEVWASFANKGNFADKSVQYRDFNNPLTSGGDTFSVSLEHGFIDPGGLVGISLRDGAVNFGSETPDDFATDALFQFYFEGGDDNYTLVDSTGEVDTGVGFSFWGIDLDLTLTSATTFDLDITRYGEPDDPAPVVTNLTGMTFAGTAGDGTIESLAFFNVDAPTQGDVYFNNLAYQQGAVPGDADGDGDVDLDDYDILSGNMYTNTAGGASAGDFNNDGFVNFEDFVIQALNFGDYPPAEEGIDALPEPATSALILIGGALALRRRR